MRNWAIIVAAGSSKRFGGDESKQFHEVNGRPLLSWTISRFESAEAVDSLIIVGPPKELDRIRDEVVEPYAFSKVRKVVAGGDTRRMSVLHGIEALPQSPVVVAIHDGARPLTSPSDICRVVETALSSGAAILAAKATDTIKKVRDSIIESSVDRRTLFYAQTPQVFTSNVIIAAHRHGKGDTDVTDDAMLVERMGGTVTVVEPEHANIKVTTEDDLLMVEALLSKEGNV